MHRLSLLCVVPLVLAGLAGCSSPDKAPEEAPQDFAPLELAATATTGLIRGVVVDNAIRPLAGVTVSLRGASQPPATSNADGLFGFDDLEPGTYFLEASKLGYFSAQGSSDVVAGVDDPPIVKMQLNLDVANQPFYILDKWDGFLECALSVIALCGVAPDGTTNDNFNHVLVIDGGVPQLIQSEVVWQTTTSASNELWLWHSSAEKGTGAFNGTHSAYAWKQGPSPLIMVSNATDIEDAKFGTENDVYLRMFTGSVSGTRNPADPEGCYPGGPGPDVYCGGVGYSIQQSFTVYTTAFVGYLPPEGWLFIDSGTVPPPA